MYLFVLFEHGNKLGDLSRPGLRLLYGLNAEQNGIAVSAFQGRKKRLCFRALIERSLKVLGNSRVAG
jgi:hypothetical protein